MTIPFTPKITSFDEAKGNLNLLLDDVFTLTGAIFSPTSTASLETKLDALELLSKAQQIVAAKDAKRGSDAITTTILTKDEAKKSTVFANYKNGITWKPPAPDQGTDQVIFGDSVGSGGMPGSGRPEWFINLGSQQSFDVYSPAVNDLAQTILLEATEAGRNLPFYHHRYGAVAVKIDTTAMVSMGFNSIILSLFHGTDDLSPTIPYSMPPYDSEFSHDFVLSNDPFDFDSGFLISSSNDFTFPSIPTGRIYYLNIKTPQSNFSSMQQDPPYVGGIVSVFPFYELPTVDWATGQSYNTTGFDIT